MTNSIDGETNTRRDRHRHRSRDRHKKRRDEHRSEKHRDQKEKRRKTTEKIDRPVSSSKSTRRSGDSPHSRQGHRNRDSRWRRSSERHPRRRRSRSKEHVKRPEEKRTAIRDIEIEPSMAMFIDDHALMDLEQQKKLEEQEKLDQEMERRRERVRKWQEKRRQDIEKNEKELDERERENAKKKKWSLEDDEDDEDMEQEEIGAAAVTENPESGGMEVTETATAAESDPLEAFMQAEVLPKMQEDVNKALFLEEKEEQNAIKDGRIDDARSVHVPDNKAEKKKEIDPYDSDASDLWHIEDEEDEEDDEEWFKRLQAGRLSKGDKLAPVDHEAITYEPFRKELYNEVREINKMAPDEVGARRKELDGIKVRGKEIPKPITTWSHAGLSERLLDVMKKAGFIEPLPIQAQALPVIMSGRDCIGIAKTGSGKTLAFVLPMLRHIKDQSTIQSGEGPIGLIMAPTRELVQQIGKEVRQFNKVLQVTSVCVYGGSGVANQINELKRGCEIVICTPGRMIDLLVTSNGKITNLRRVTFLVLDEADRMFDMGFEPQITRIVNNIRPDRQTVMFSATFPRQVELLARKLLQDPIEILIGGRSVVNADITQFVEIRPQDDRLLRTLEILGQWSDKGKVLIFVNSQESCDVLFRDLLRQGYPCLSLHGGKDQNDRESTLSDFKGSVCNLLIATSVAARGLDVRDLVLVLNYEVPNHHEDYVHRVGRTGRAGNKGTAITFISGAEEKYAPDLVKALKESKAAVPQDLQKLAESFAQKKSKGLALAHGSGYGGSGFKFDEHEEDERKALRKAQKKGFRMEDDTDSEDESALANVKHTLSLGTAAKTNGSVDGMDIKSLPQVQAAHQLAAKMAAQAANAGAMSVQSFGAPIVPPFTGMFQGSTQSPADNPILAAAKAAAGQIAAKAGIGGATVSTAPTPSPFAPGSGMIPLGERHFEAELEINDFPQHARWKITHRDTLAAVNELTGAAVTTRGLYMKPGTQLGFGERKLYLLIEGVSETSVRKAKAELKKILAETTEKVLRRDTASTGKYSVL